MGVGGKEGRGIIGSLDSIQNLVGQLSTKYTNIENTGGKYSPLIGRISQP